MQIATWNVNSIRTRLSHVITWLQDAEPLDLLCLQETKVTDDKFPYDEFHAIGYHSTVYGQKTYNGVALISRQPLQEIHYGFAAIVGSDQVGDLDDQKRVITGILDGIRIVNVYIPNGESVGSSKYDYKLNWMGMLKRYLSILLRDQTTPIVLCGDFNVAPADKDIHDPQKAGQIMASDPERQALAEIAHLGLTDAFRHFTPDPGYYSWWDYRAGSFPRNKGWRIDHHYISQALVGRAQSCVIDVEPRGWEKPSDHTPVVLELLPD